jgi:hypothetical protein
VEVSKGNFTMPPFPINAAQWIVYDALYAYCRHVTAV